MSSVTEMLQGAFDDAEPQVDLVVGDRVRSYDFAGNFDCYVEGVVEAITDPIEGCPRYEIRVQCRVFNSQPVDPGAEHVYPPVNGTPTWSGKLTNLVVKAPAH